MIKHPQLHAVSTGQASVEVAARALEALLAERTAAIDQAIYEALRDWTWKALRERRLDQDLVGWRDLIEGARARLPDDQSTLRTGLRTLSELVSISIQFSSTVTDEAVAGYAHVRDILEAVAANGHAINRQEIKRTFKLSDGRLSQLLGLLVQTGHLDREPRGRTAQFTITAKGQKLLGRQPTAPLAAPDLVQFGYLSKTPAGKKKTRIAWTLNRFRADASMRAAYAMIENPDGTSSMRLLDVSKHSVGSGKKQGLRATRRKSRPTTGSKHGGKDKTYSAR